MIMEEQRTLTKDYFFDNDCLSSFMWANRTDVMLHVCRTKIVVPQMVETEMSVVSNLKNQLDSLISRGIVEVQDIESDTEAYELYYEFTENPDKGYKIIGGGEAAALAMAKENNGIIASNNLRDILYYIKKYSIELITTADIMKKAYEDKYISEKEGNAIWAEMLRRKRRLPGISFTDYLSKVDTMHDDKKHT